MNLPNYFLADLPSEATLTPALLTEACQTLKRNRAQYLAQRSTGAIIRTLDEIARQWLQPGYPLRQLALQRGPAAVHFSRPTLERGLDNFFRQLTGEHLEALVAIELGHGQRLDDLVATSAEQRGRRAAFARGPDLVLHIAAGHVPNPTLMSIVLGLLARSAQLVKCATGTSLLPRLFAHSLYEAEPKLGACLEIAEWRGGDSRLEAAVFAEADGVTATGADETLAQIRERLPARTRFIGYGHRVSFGYITGEALSGFGAARVVEQAAADVVAWNQLGCLSPHLFYAENGGRVGPEQFAELLAAELARREAAEPRGPVPAETAAMIASRRAFYEVRAAHSPETRQWRSENSTAWTVVFETDPRFQLSCLNRFIHVKATPDLVTLLHAAEPVRGHVSTVGLGASESQARALALAFARWGATRVCPLGQMQNPPLAWRHDGRPALGDLVTWTDWEEEPQ